MARQISDYEQYITTLITKEQIEARVIALAKQLDEDYAGKELMMIGVLKGVFPFFADLVRQMDLACRCDFLGLSSYGSRTETSGVVRLTSDLTQPINNREVLVVEDIVDTGLTMQYLLENLRTRGPSSVKICTLLHKPDNGRVEVPVDYVGFTIPNHFVVGYGLDYDERFRNMPYIGYFADEIPELD